MHPINNFILVQIYTALSMVENGYYFTAPDPTPSLKSLLKTQEQIMFVVYVSHC